MTPCVNMPVENLFRESGHLTSKEVFFSVTVSELGLNDTTSANKIQGVSRSQPRVV